MYFQTNFLANFEPEIDAAVKFLLWKVRVQLVFILSVKYEIIVPKFKTGL